MAQFRVVGALGYGIMTLLVVNNVDGAGDYLSELGRTTVHFLSWGKDRLTGGGGDGSPDLLSLNSKLDRIAELHSRGGGVHVVHSGPGSSATSWVYTLVVGTGCTLLLVHITGLFDLSGYAYVTQAKFKTATEALGASIAHVSKSLEEARVDLLAKLGVVERKLDTVRTDLQAQIASTGNEINANVAHLSSDIQGLVGEVGGLESRLDGIHSGVGDLQSQIEYANRGITLLVNVVQDSYYHDRHGKQRPDGGQLVNELEDFSKQQAAAKPAALLKQTPAQGPVLRFISKPAPPREAVLATADDGGGAQKPVMTPLAEKLTKQMAGV